MTIFPYVYPDIESDTFKYQANVVVGLFLFIFYLALILVAARAIKQLWRKPKNQPIFNKVEEAPKSETEILRDMWMEQPETIKKPEKKEEQKVEQQPVMDDSKAPPPVINEKGGLETEEDENSDEEEEEETESETESDESSDNNEGDAEEYSNLRRIPQADVNLADTGIGFSTGMSALREAKIQQYREKEKNMY